MLDCSELVSQLGDCRCQLNAVVVVVVVSVVFSADLIQFTCSRHQVIDDRLIVANHHVHQLRTGDNVATQKFYAETQ